VTANRFGPVDTYRTVAFFLCLALSAAPAAAQHVSAGEVTVHDAWARASVGRNGAAYFMVTVEEEQADRLVAARTPVAANAEIHETSSEGGVMRMRPVAGVTVTPEAPVVLRPGGMHLMLMGLTRRLAPGERFPLTLVFERAGAIEIEVAVGAVGAMGPSGHEGHHEEGSHEHGHGSGHGDQDGAEGHPHGGAGQ